MADSRSDTRTVITAAKIGAVATVIGAIITVGLPALLSGQKPPAPVPTVDSRPPPFDTERPTADPVSTQVVRSFADWRREADAVCDAAFANLNALGGPAESWEDYVNKGTAAINITQTMAESLRSTEMPSTRTDDIATWIDELDSVVLAHSRAVDAAARGDEGAVAEASTELSIALERANEAARVLGLDCIFLNQ